MDSKQFNNQVLTLSDKFFRLAKSILRNADFAQDAVQDLILKLWEKRNNLDEVDNIQAFSMRSMRNLCLDYIRQRHEELDLPPDIEFVELNPHQQVEQRDMVSRVKELIDSLPELQRTVIRLRDVEGMEISEIAHITELTENAVTVNLSRSRQKIRERILNEQKKTDATIWKT